jgi:adenosine deaminase
MNGSEDMQGDFFVRLPKTELHAHLTGSVSVADLQELAALRNFTLPIGFTKPRETIELDEFFPLFSNVIYKLVNDAEAITFICQRVIQSFWNDNVTYLELRSTPRDSIATGLSKDSYVKTLMDAVNKYTPRGM